MICYNGVVSEKEPRMETKFKVGDLVRVKKEHSKNMLRYSTGKVILNGKTALVVGFDLRYRWEEYYLKFFFNDSATFTFDEFSIEKAY